MATKEETMILYDIFWTLYFGHHSDHEESPMDECIRCIQIINLLNEKFNTNLWEL